MRMSRNKYKLVTEYPIKEYQCGLRVNDRVRLKRDIIVRDHTGKVYPKGEVWTVLSGSKEKPVAVWFRQANGERHTWDDDQSIFETFEVIPTS
jgi:hypothetical protein